jgi:hypothetical protein
LKLKEAIADRSSRYYELIPIDGHKTEALAPIDNGSQISQQLKTILSLLNIEIPIKVLLGMFFVLHIEQ